MFLGTEPDSDLYLVNASVLTVAGSHGWKAGVVILGEVGLHYKVDG